MIHEASGLEYQETKSKNRAKLPAGSGQQFLIGGERFFCQLIFDAMLYALCS